jgi:predicted dienelactone hydrolase
MLALIAASIAGANDAKAQDNANFRSNGQFVVPTFKTTTSFSTVVSGNGDEADVYYPDSPSHHHTQLPIAVLLQGALVDKQYYSTFASEVARHGFVVVVPNHRRSIPPFFINALIPETSVALHAFDHIRAEGVDPSSPLYGRVDGSRLALLGHSLGARTALELVDGAPCKHPLLCSSPSDDRPAELKAAAFYGTTTRDQATGQNVDIDSTDVPVALLSGSKEGVALPAFSREAYYLLEPSQAFISVTGANHFGITDVQAPPGARADSSVQTLSQSESIQYIAEWSATFLRAHVMHSPSDDQRIYKSGGSRDGVVVVDSER